MNDTSIYGEIRKIISDKVASGQIVVVDWLTHEIISAKAEIQGSDLEFYRVCAFTHVKDVVKRCVGKYGPKQEADDQLVLSGFAHLQVAYSVVRDGDVVLVPVDFLTDDEIEARAQDYELMSKGLIAHARELRSFKRSRRSAA